MCVCVYLSLCACVCVSVSVCVYVLHAPQENDRAFADPIAAGDYESARGYCNVKWWPGGTTTDLQFWFFCAMNGPGEVCLCVHCVHCMVVCSCSCAGCARVRVYV